MSEKAVLRSTFTIAPSSTSIQNSSLSASRRIKSSCVMVWIFSVMVKSSFISNARYIPTTFIFGRTVIRPYKFSGDLVVQLILILQASENVVDPLRCFTQATHTAFDLHCAADRFRSGVFDGSHGIGELIHANSLLACAGS